MNFSKLAMCFAIFVFCVFCGVNANVQKLEASTENWVEIDEALNTAIDAAVDGIVLSTDGYSIEVSREQCVKNFYRTLYACLGVDATNKQAQELIGIYVPVIGFIDEDGFYAQYSESVDGNVMKVWGPKTTYTKEYLIQKGSLVNEYWDCVIDYSLTDLVTIRIDGRVYSDNWKILKKHYANATSDDAGIAAVVSGSIFATDNSFEAERDSVVTDCIVDRVGYYTNRHNDIAAKYGVSRVFQLPSSARSSIARSIDSVSFLVFFEGYPIGRGSTEVYTKFGVGGARVAKKQFYCISEQDGYLYYHEEECPELEGVSGINRYTTREECAILGALPCEKCKP